MESIDSNEVATAVTVKSSPIESARKIFRQELKPLLQESQKLRYLKRTIREYEQSLYAAVSDKVLDEEIIDSASFIVRGKGLKKQDKVDNPDLDELAKAKAMNAGKVFDWFKTHYSGTTTLLLSHLTDEDGRINPEREKYFAELVGTNLSHWIIARKGLGKVFKEEIQGRELSQMTNFLLKNSSYFSSLNKHLLKQKHPSLADIDAAYGSLVTQEAVLDLNSQVQAFELRDWIATTAKEARQGRKIYETPFYRKILEETHFIGRKKNGVGGVILYGPPGTGKTELLQQKNKEQGFKTRVVNIHHYSSFEDLIAGKAIQLGIDRGATVVQKLSAVLNQIEGESPESLIDYLNEVYLQLGREGKLSRDQTFGNFLFTVVSAEAAEEISQKGVVAKDDLSAEDCQKIKEGFLTRQKARITRAILPDAYQEGIEDIVRGEILLAIQNGEKVVLDEIDKAGPNSLGGILSFLAKSPGESFEIGQTTVTIPAWFNVDATSNSLELNEYLKDRFSHLEVGTPPIKDQLMIAVVRLADDEGNIFLSEYEQTQLAGFFMYLVPEINRLLGSQNLAPLSNRSIQELTSYLVDFGTMKRTDVSFGEAVKMLLLQNKMWTKNPVLAEGISSLLIKFPQITADRPYEFDHQGELAQAGENLTSLEQIEQRKERTLEKTVNSPLISAINGLPEEKNLIRKPKIREIRLNNDQKDYVKNFFTYKEETGTVDVRKLPIGLILFKGLDLNFDVRRVSNGKEEQVVLSKNYPEEKGGRIEAFSADGRQVVISNEIKDASTLSLKILDLSNPEKTKPTALTDIQSGSAVYLDAFGKYLYIIDKKNYLTVLDVDSKGQRTKDSIRSIQIAPDGSVFLTEDLNGKMSLVSPENLEVIVHLPGPSWRFAGNDLIVQETKEGNISESAFSLTRFKN